MILFFLLLTHSQVVSPMTTNYIVFILITKQLVLWKRYENPILINVMICVLDKIADAKYNFTMYFWKTLMKKWLQGITTNNKPTFESHMQATNKIRKSPPKSRWTFFKVTIPWILEKEPIQGDDKLSVWFLPISLNVWSK